MVRVPAIFAALAVAVTILAAAGCGGASTATPTHVAAMFVDGFNHADMRQVCSTIEPSVVRHNWGGMAGCEAYFTVNLAQAFMFGATSGYRIVPHSEKGWREGRAEVASVKAVYLPNGAVLKFRLVKTATGWRIAGAS